MIKIWVSSHVIVKPCFFFYCNMRHALSILGVGSIKVGPLKSLNFCSHDPNKELKIITKFCCSLGNCQS